MKDSKNQQKEVRSGRNGIKMGKKWWKLVKLGKNAFSACQWYKKRGYEHILDPKNCT